MKRRHSARKRTQGTLAGAALIALALSASGCGSGGGDAEGGGGPSVSYGATQEEYLAAFEDVEPITLYSQVLYAPDNLHNDLLLKYFEEVETWSGGKITFDTQFSSAVAPYAETFDAIVDGRLDIGYATPSFQPQDFPASTAWNTLAALGQTGAFPGVLHTHSWMTEAMAADENVRQEFQDYGLHLLNPFAYGGVDSGLVCTSDIQDLQDFEGTSWLVQSREQEHQAAALGMTAVSLPFQDWFSALQRGIGDCAGITATSAHSNGLFDVAPHLILDEQEFIGSVGAGSLVINDEVWNGLPLVSRQLLFDKLDVLAFAMADSVHTARLIESLAALEDIPGSTIRTFSEEAREAAAGAQRELGEEAMASGAIDGSPAEIQQEVEDLTARWDGLLDDLDLPVISYAELTSEWETADVDLEAWAQLYFEEALLPHRPE